MHISHEYSNGNVGINTTIHRLSIGKRRFLGCSGEVGPSVQLGGFGLACHARYISCKTAIKQDNVLEELFESDVQAPAVSKRVSANPNECSAGQS